MLTILMDFRFCLIAIIAYFCFSTFSYASDTKTLRIGVLAFAHTEAVLSRWQPTITRLETDLDTPVQLVVLTPTELDEAVEQKTVDFIITNALTAVSYKKDHGTSSLLTLVPLMSSNPAFAVGSALVTHQELEVNSVTDLSQLKVVSTDRKAFGGFQIFAGQMAQQGLNPFDDFKQLDFVGFPQNKLLSMIEAGDTDIAILPTCVLENAIKHREISATTLKVVLTKPSTELKCQSSSKLYPYYSFSKLGKTDHRLATKVIKSLLSIHATDDAAFYGRYDSWSATVNDSSVFKLLRQLQQWPFVTNWTSIFKTALPWVIAGFIFLFLGYLHHLRVKRLVVLRTHDLKSEIYQHKMTQDALFTQTEQFYKAQRVLLTGEMASGIAHELNQPLAGIRYLTQGCIYRLSAEQTELKEAMTKAIQQVDRAQETIQRFRNFCHQPSVMSHCNINMILDDTLTLMAAEFSRVKLNPQLTLENIGITGDASLLQQVFVNIIRNALDAMEDVAKPQLFITMALVGDQVKIEFTDNGKGLLPQELERLFFPFETSKKNGLGLGMIICKRIIEEHHGEISACNNRDIGLTLTITLPLE
ncbi:Sensor histidine kinase [Shewanella piezotolerans WP3]|uniref:histidine kinase n=1 Tax=Shewanella piezotolerans (strain WP3 / JCM 13877) TaxID=225849 RepID=B8CP10_SHEPW|nr:Sensor histidine kinase [Shewanella piezotolerans WP3]